jgi:YegS/Rv2252/BmrU family lipid kinase
MRAEQMERYRIIANPAAGSGRGERAIPGIEGRLDQLDIEYDLARTEGAWHARDLAREAVAQGYSVVVAAGGDGTVNEVINGLVEAKQSGEHGCALGVLSTGRGNDFGASMGIPDNLDHAVQVLNDGRRRLIDIGRVAGGRHPEGRYFGNCVGVGFDAIGTIEAAKLPRLGGFLSYFVAVLRTIFLYYNAPLTRVEFDEQMLTQPSLMVSVMNGRRLGGGFLMAPCGEPDDGLFDLCIAGEMSRARMFGMIPHFLRGTQATQKEIFPARAARVSITALQGSLPAQTDGEILCVDGQRLEIELLPQELHVLCPPQE